MKRLSVKSLEELEKKIGSFINTYNKYYNHPYIIGNLMVFCRKMLHNYLWIAPLVSCQPCNVV